MCREQTYLALPNARKHRPPIPIHHAAAAPKPAAALCRALFRALHKQVSLSVIASAAAAALAAAAAFARRLLLFEALHARAAALAGARLPL